MEFCSFLHLLHREDTDQSIRRHGQNLIFLDSKSGDINTLSLSGRKSDRVDLDPVPVLRTEVMSQQDIIQIAFRFFKISLVLGIDKRIGLLYV
jgi:hypothetical protein